MRKPFIGPAAFALLGSSSFSPFLAAAPLTLDKQVVTATRSERPVRASLAATTVFDRAEIERSQARSVPELLQKVPGVTLSNNGSPGKNTTLFLRGSESDHVLVLIDGIKVGSVSAGITAFQDLPVELIERIEVVRGPRSSLYGSEAIGGVIQIFTRKGGEGAAKPWFSAGYGTVDLRGEYWLTEEWRLQAKVTNLLDADYESALDYNQPGQAVFFTVRYQSL
nr:TonB-dependent receptor plug domain-containing protein [Pseudomonas sp. TCU-HL1]